MLQFSENGRCEEFYIFLSKVLADNRDSGCKLLKNFLSSKESLWTSFRKQLLKQNTGLENLAYMNTTGTEFDDLTQKFHLKHMAVFSIVKSLVVNI